MCRPPPHLPLVLWGKKYIILHLKTFMSISVVFSANHQTKFDAAVLGFVTPDVHSQDLLASVAKTLRPSGTVYLHEVIVSQENGSHIRTAEKVESALKLAGFVNVSKV